MRAIFKLLVIVLLLISCQKRDVTNPFDSSCPKEIWTPTNFSAVQEGTTVKLTWNQPMNNISGFKITKKIESGSTTELPNQNKDANQFVDASLTGGKLHTYTIVAYAGSNLSNVLTATVTPVLVAGGITTTAITITANSITSGYTITTDGGSPITARGVCWGTAPSPTISGNKTTDGTGIGNFTSLITGYSPNTTYYVRAYATNSIGTTYGNEVSFTTPAIASTITTSAMSAITSSTAFSGGNITADGGGAITARGVCWNTASAPTISNNKTTDGTGIGSYVSTITSLNPGTTYFLRAYAINSVGTSYGNEVTFTTLALPPTITTTAISTITVSSASSGGSISSDGGGTITARGVCWGTTPGPTISNNKTTDGTGTGSFISLISGLSPGTKYYVRAYATNSAGTSYGLEASFTTISAGSVTDIDGNVYSTVIIGTQEWMASNLKTTRYKDGTIIPLVTDASSWLSLSSPGYCWPNNSAANKDTYGVLYNWYTVNTNKLCPTGWHVPSDAEWTTLTNYLGGETVAGGKLKETGTIHWDSPNTGATNETGFSAVPSGYRSGDFDKFAPIGYGSFWWASESTQRDVLYNSSNVIKSVSFTKDGFSVRCLKGELTPPTVSTNSISNITTTTAIGGGNCTSDGGVAITARGVCWGTTTGPTISNNKTNDGSGIGSYTSTITGLSPGITYYVRAYATSSAGTAYGTEVSFKTIAILPTITTAAITNITASSASSGGNITSDGGGAITARGVCWGTTPGPTISNNKTTDGTGTGSFISLISGLTPGTNYYVRAYATNSTGTSYGLEASFTTIAVGSVTDVDGNVYSTVIIGTQEWMASNLKTTRYNDGTLIPLVTDNVAWSQLTTPGYCWYNNAIANKNTYGTIYNWYTANSSKLCPTGWHVPNDSEWTTLVSYLGGESVAGEKLKETGTNQWVSPNFATNESGFTALPGGYRYYDDGVFYWFGQGTGWWSSGEVTSTNVWCRRVVSESKLVEKATTSKQYGVYVRCLKGQEITVNIPTNGLVAYYPFNSNAIDESGNGHNGTVNGATLTADRVGRAGKAYHFDGSTSYIRVPNSPSLLPGSGSYSFSGWYKLTNAPINSTVYFFAIDDGDSDYSGVQAFYEQGTQRLRFMYHYDDSWTHSTYINAHFDLNGWHHVLSIFDRPNLTGKLYIDGVLMATTTLDNNNVTATTDLYLGRRPFSSTTDVFFQGDQDDIRIYNRVLSDQEIQSLYKE